MDKGHKLYIAYGSNLNLARMADRCPTAAVAGASELSGYRLLFRGPHAGAVAAVEPFKGGRVPVLVWAITPADEAALDRYEGFPERCSKEQAKVRLDGRTVTAMLYLVNERTLPGRPGAYHYESILEGYAAAGFDTELLRKALLDSIEMADSL